MSEKVGEKVACRGAHVVTAYLSPWGESNVIAAARCSGDIVRLYSRGIHAPGIAQLNVEFHLR